MLARFSPTSLNLPHVVDGENLMNVDGPKVIPLRPVTLYLSCISILHILKYSPEPELHWI